MKIAYTGKDYIEINEKNLNEFTHIEKIHLIKLSFEEPDEKLIKKVLQLYPNTNRFIISDKIKVYNDILKTTNKKYYVENNYKTFLITFFRKNNKVLLNFEKLSENIKAFILSDVQLLEDILRNVEVVSLNEDTFNKHKELFSQWSGNVILL